MANENTTNCNEPFCGYCGKSIKSITELDNLYNNDTFILIANAKTGMVCFNYKEKRVESIPGELKKILVA